MRFNLDFTSARLCAGMFKHPLLDWRKKCIFAVYVQSHMVNFGCLQCNFWFLMGVICVVLCYLKWTHIFISPPTCKYFYNLQFNSCSISDSFLFATILVRQSESWHEMLPYLRSPELFVCTSPGSDTIFQILRDKEYGTNRFWQPEFRLCRDVSDQQAPRSRRATCSCLPKLPSQNLLNVVTSKIPITPPDRPATMGATE